MELSLAPEISPSGLSTVSQRKQPPEFRLVKGQLPQLRPRAIETAVSAFMAEVDPKGDHVGFFNQTLKTIASATFLGGTNDFWLAHEDGEVMAYATGYVCNDIDDRLTYYVPQAWLHPRYRRNKIFKTWWNQIRQRAKDCLAQHLVIVSARNPKAFARLLGNGLHVYAVTMKEDF